MTFSITDIVSEVSGKKKANRLVTAFTIASSFFAMHSINADVVPATT